MEDVSGSPKRKEQQQEGKLMALLLLLPFLLHAGFSKGKALLGHARHMGRMDKNWEDGSDTSAVYVNRGWERRV